MKQRALALGLICMLGAPLGCARVLYNFGTIEPDRVYRSAQPSPLFLRWLVRHTDIKTLVNLRGRTQGFESQFAAANGLRLYSFDLSASRPPTQADVDRFLAILDDPANHPVLVHCRNGVDRTGYMVAIYRMERQGWTAERAQAEMRRFLQFRTLNPAPSTVIQEGARRIP